MAENEEHSKRLLKIVQKDFSRDVFREMTVENMISVIAAADAAKLFTLLYPKLECILPLLLRKAYSARESSYCGLTLSRVKFLKKVAKNSSEKNVPYLLFKGVALSSLIYGDLERRQSGDIDFIVSPENVSAFDCVLRDVGAFQPYFPLEARKKIGHACLLSSDVAIQASSFLLREKIDSPHYTPYYYKDESTGEFLTIEVHDRLHFTKASCTRTLMLHGVSGLVKGLDNVITFGVEATYVVLVENTFENSETVFANQAEGWIGLRDHVDLHFFLMRYAAQMDWHCVDNLLHLLGLKRAENVVLSAQIQLYPMTSRAVAARVAPCVDWGMSYPERLVNSTQRRYAARQRIRNHIAENTHCYADLMQKTSIDEIYPSFELADCLRFIQLDSNSIEISWAMNLFVLYHLRDGVLQLNITPLRGDGPLYYRINCFEKDGSWNARLVASAIMSQGGHPSKDVEEGVGIPIILKQDTSICEFSVSIPNSSICLTKGVSIAVSACVYECGSNGVCYRVGPTPYDAPSVCYTC